MVLSIVADESDNQPDQAEKSARDACSFVKALQGSRRLMALYLLYYNKHMTRKARVVTFRPDEEALQAMERLRREVGVPYSEQLRRALKAWFESQEVLKRTGRTRKRTRR